MEKLYRTVVAESKPMGSVAPAIAQVHCYGNIALVHTTEEVGRGSALLAAVRKRRGDPAPADKKVMLACGGVCST